MTTLYISDLDGTLLHDNQQVSPFSASVINRAVERGLLFSLATARSLIGHGGSSRRQARCARSTHRPSSDGTFDKTAPGNSH